MTFGENAPGAIPSDVEGNAVLEYRNTCFRTPLKIFSRGAGAAVLALALAGDGRAQQLDAMVGPLIEIETEGKGPGEKVIALRLSPNAVSIALPDEKVLALGQAMLDRNAAEEEDLAIDAALQALGFRASATNAAGTFLEHALWVDRLGPFNGVMNDLGLVIAIGQMARDIAKGDERAATVGGLKAYMNWAISKWGWRSVQIGGVALFVFDLTLSKWQSGLTEIAVDVWYCRYSGWYQENGLSVGDWKVKAWDLYLAAEGKSDLSYDTYIDGVLNDYVGLAFRDPLLASFGDCSGSSFGDQDAIKSMIMAEHKAVLREMMASKVMPDIAERARLRMLRAQVVKARDTLLPKLNSTFLLEVTVYDVDGPARVVMPLPAGGEWAGKLREDGTFRASLTFYAVLKAGFPDTVRLETGAGVEERKLTMSGDRLTAMFGAPQTPLVSRYRLSEGAQSCTVKRIGDDGSATAETASAGAKPTTEVDFAMLSNGAWVFGRFTPGAGWTPASPGLTEGDRITFGAPMHDGIRAFTGCTIGFLTDDALAAGTCTVERFERKAVNDHTTIERTCTAAAGLEIIGVHAALGSDDMQYFSMDGPEGQMMLEVLKRSMAEGVKSFDLDSLPGMPGMPGVP
jgi:hypothetical protein